MSENANEKIARIVIPELGNGAFQFPIAEDYTVRIELKDIEETMFDQFYALFDDQYRMNIGVLATKVWFEGDFQKIEFKGKDENGKVTCVIQVGNIDSFGYNKNAVFD